MRCSCESRGFGYDRAQTRSWPPGAAPHLDRDRDGLLVFFVGVVLFRVAAAVYFLTHLLVAAAPMVMLASRIAIAGPTSNTTRRVVGQWGGAGGAICEDHFAAGVEGRELVIMNCWYC